MTPFDLDEAATRRSQRRLMEIDVKLVIHNHDAGQWATFRRAPDGYR